MTANIDFMKNLLNRVEGNTTPSDENKTSSGKDIIMENILDRFTKAVEDSASNVIIENDPPVVVDEDKVVTTNWIITNEGTDDEFNYTVKDRKSGSVVAEGLYTYTIANKFAELLNNGHTVNSSKFQQLLSLNNVFESKFDEVNAYKQRLKQTKDVFKTDLYEAKLQTSKDKAFDLLAQIKKFW